MTTAMTTRAATQQLARAHARVGPAVTLVVGIMSTFVIASSLVLVLTLLVTAVHAGTTTPGARRWRARHAVRAARRQRRDRREERLRAANICTLELTQLAELVAQVLDGDPADRLELEALLDRYVETALARQRCVTLVAPGEVARLETKLAVAQHGNARSAAILERRVAQSRAITARARDLEEEISALAELIRLYGQRAALEIDGEHALDSEVVSSALARFDACVALDAPRAFTLLSRDAVSNDLAEPRLDFHGVTFHEPHAAVTTCRCAPSSSSPSAASLADAIAAASPAR